MPINRIPMGQLPRELEELSEDTLVSGSHVLPAKQGWWDYWEWEAKCSADLRKGLCSRCSYEGDDAE